MRFLLIFVRVWEIFDYVEIPDKDRFIRAYDDGDEKYFYRNGVQEARWIVLERKNKIEFSETIKDYWKQALITELKRSKKSGFKKFHEPIVYEAVMNLSYRNKLLEEVYHEPSKKSTSHNIG
ncbi:MAG: hypothetical protein J7K81_05010 [Methanophagales archaeon]|nr:hypothetical protein [Methanophagales archaeon]